MSNGTGPRPPLHGKSCGWLRATLVCRVDIPLDEWEVGHADETIRRNRGQQMRERLAHEALRSLFQDRLALSMTVDGVERLVQ